MTEQDNQYTEMTHQLKELNKRIERQVSLKHIFITGIVYGFGFIIGTAVLATISLGLFGPWFAEIDWIRETFERGAELK